MYIGIGGKGEHPLVEISELSGEIFFVYTIIIYIMKGKWEYIYAEVKKYINLKLKAETSKGRNFIQ